MANFNGFDYAIWALLFLSITIGIIRGFVREVIALLAWIAAFIISTLYSVSFAALFISPPANAGTKPIDYMPMAAIIISYLTLFIGTLICGSILKFIVNYIVEGSGLSVVNRLLGAILGLARGAVIVIVVMFFLTYTALVKQALWKDSKMVVLFQPTVKWVTVMAQPYVSIIEAKMKKTAKNLDEEEAMPDVIKTKPAATLPSAPATPVPAAPVAAPLPIPAHS